MKRSLAANGAMQTARTGLEEGETVLLNVADVATHLEDDVTGMPGNLEVTSR